MFRRPDPSNSTHLFLPSPLYSSPPRPDTYDHLRPLRTPSIPPRTPLRPGARRPARISYAHIGPALGNKGLQPHAPPPTSPLQRALVKIAGPRFPSRPRAGPRSASRPLHRRNPFRLPPLWRRHPACLPSTAGILPASVLVRASCLPPPYRRLPADRFPSPTSDQTNMLTTGPELSILTRNGAANERR